VASFALSTWVALVGRVAFVPGAARAEPVQPAAATLHLASQTPWVAPGAEWDLRVVARVAHPADDADLAVTVYRPLPTRSQFRRTLDDDVRGLGTIARPIVAPLRTLGTDAGGAIDVRLPVTDHPVDNAHLMLTTSGVYPVQVELRGHATGTRLAVLTTHLVYIAAPAPIASDKLKVVWVVRAHAHPRTGTDGADVLEPFERERLGAVADALRAHPEVPVVLDPTPDTLAALARTGEPTDKRTLTGLTTASAAHQVIAGPYVPLTLAAMLAANLDDEVTAELTAGATTLTTLVGSSDLTPGHLDRQTWIEDGPMDGAALSFLTAHQVNYVVLPDADLTPNPLPITPAQPFELESVAPVTTPTVANPTGLGRLTRPVTAPSRVRAAVVDPGLSADFAAQPNTALGAHQLLADLAQIYFDRPGQSRGVILMAPLAWRPEPGFLDLWLSGLANSPVVQPATLAEFFATVPMATTGHAPLVRRLSPNESLIRAMATSFPVEGVRAERRRIESFATALTPDNPLPTRLLGGLLVTSSNDLATARGRRAQLDAVDAAINRQLAMIQLPPARAITLTARTGKLPITILSQADYPVRVVLRIESDKLSFPTRPHTAGVATQEVLLRKALNTVDFDVKARTAGAFPLRVTLLSPDGNLVLARTSFTVHSTAFSGVGLLLSVGAALFLAAWWARQLLRGRRASRPPALARTKERDVVRAEPDQPSLVGPGQS